MAQVTLQVGEQTYYIGLGHDLPGTSQWNELHSHARALRFRWPGMDLIIKGDKHQYATAEVPAYPDEYEAGRRSSPFVHFVQVGTAKTGPDKYTIQRWSQGQFEWPYIVFYPDEHKIKVTRHLEDVKLWLGV
jgi:hypothetical protein